MHIIGNYSSAIDNALENAKLLLLAISSASKWSSLNKFPSNSRRLIAVIDGISGITNGSPMSDAFYLPADLVKKWYTGPGSAHA